MDFQHCLGVEPTFSVHPTGLQELGVEPLKVLGADMTQRDPAKLGQDVVFDVASIRVPGARSKCQLLGWQPSSGQVGPERWSGAAPEVLTLFSGELRREVDCPVAIGARGMPAASFTTSDRVDPFVDDRVETVPPLRHIAAHRAVPPAGRAVPSGGTYRWNFNVRAARKALRPGDQLEGRPVLATRLDCFADRQRAVLATVSARFSMTVVLLGFLWVI
jgi:hypothetical protein